MGNFCSHDDASQENEIEYKLATYNIVSQAMKLNQLCFRKGENYPKWLWVDLIVQKSSYVAMHGSKLIGYIMTKPLHPYPGQYVYTFAVHPSYRKRGIGTNLFKLVLDQVKKNPDGLMSLHVKAQNQSAINLYLKCGLREKEREPGYYQDGEDGLLLTNELQLIGSKLNNS